MNATWLLLMVWSASYGAIAAPTSVAFHSEADCRVIGAAYEQSFPRRNRHLPPYHAFWLVDWRCVKVSDP